MRSSAVWPPRTLASSGAGTASTRMGIPTAACHVFSTLLAPEAPPAIQGSISRLHDPLCAMEVTEAQNRLRRNKASGNNGIRAEHLLDAQELLLEPPASMSTQLLLEGVPECLWGSFILSTKQGQGMTQATTAVSQSRPSSPRSLPYA